MLRKIAKLVTITLIIFVISFLNEGINYANNFKENTNWKVVITSDTKELIDTQEIKFKVENNENVVKNKIAPGLKAVANIDIDFEKTQGLADIKVNIDESKLYNCFIITLKLNGEDYELDSVKTIELNNYNKNQQLMVELKWIGNNNELDTYIGSQIENISIPITIKVSQHI